MTTFRGIKSLRCHVDCKNELFYTEDVRNRVFGLWKTPDQSLANHASVKVPTLWTMAGLDNLAYCSTPWYGNDDRPGMAGKMFRFGFCKGALSQIGQQSRS